MTDSDILVSDSDFLNHNYFESNYDSFFNTVMSHIISLQSFDITQKQSIDEYFLPRLFDFTFLLRIFDSFDEKQKTNSGYLKNPLTSLSENTFSPDQEFTMLFKKSPLNMLNKDLIDSDLSEITPNKKSPLFSNIPVDFFDVHATQLEYLNSFMTLKKIPDLHNTSVSQSQQNSLTEDSVGENDLSLDLPQVSKNIIYPEESNPQSIALPFTVSNPVPEAPLTLPFTVSNPVPEAPLTLPFTVSNPVPEAPLTLPFTVSNPVPEAPLTLPFTVSNPVPEAPLTLPFTVSNPVPEAPLTLPFTVSNHALFSDELHTPFNNTLLSNSHDESDSFSHRTSFDENLVTPNVKSNKSNFSQINESRKILPLEQSSEQKNILDNESVKNISFEKLTSEKTSQHNFVNSNVSMEYLKTPESPRDFHNALSVSDSITTVQIQPLLSKIPVLEKPSVETVKIHTGSFANSLTKSIHADAITLNNEIFFRDGKFNLSSYDGIGLLTHELAHVSQNEDLGNSKIDLQQYNKLENEALANESMIVSHFYASSNNFVSNHTHENFPNDIQDEKSLHFPPNLITLESSSMLEFTGDFVVPKSHNSVPNFGVSGSNTSNSAMASSMVPFTAAEDRDVSASHVPSEPSPSASPVLDVEDLADQVYEIIADKIKRERERKGYK